jgi:hypothetical protein
MAYERVTRRWPTRPDARCWSGCARAAVGRRIAEGLHVSRLAVSPAPQGAGGRGSGAGAARGRTPDLQRRCRDWWSCAVPREVLTAWRRSGTFDAAPCDDQLGSRRLTGCLRAPRRRARDREEEEISRARSERQSVSGTDQERGERVRPPGVRDLHRAHRELVAAAPVLDSPGRDRIRRDRAAWAARCTGLENGERAVGQGWRGSRPDASR